MLHIGFITTLQEIRVNMTRFTIAIIHYLNVDDNDGEVTGTLSPIAHQQFCFQKIENWFQLQNWLRTSRISEMWVKRLLKVQKVFFTRLLSSGVQEALSDILSSETEWDKNSTPVQYYYKY